MVWSSVSNSYQRIVSVWLKRLSIDRFQRQAREAKSSVGDPTRPVASPVDAPVVIAGKHGPVEILVAVDARAERLGLRPGLALAQARAMHPGLTVLPEDRARDHHLLEAIADWCQRYTPLTGIEVPDGILLDITGCAHLFGGEPQLVEDLAERIAGLGFTARIAVASTIGAASGAARFSATRYVDAGRERDFLSALPLAALRLPAETVMALARVGLKNIGDLIDLPRAPLTARFGGDLLRQLDRALGREFEPLMPRLPVAPYVAEQRFAEPIAREEDVLAVTERLAAQLKPLLEYRGEGARQFELALFRTDGRVRRIAVATSRPLRKAQDIRALFVERLTALADPLDPGFGFDVARLAVLRAEPRPPEQIDLARPADPGDLDGLVDRLSARLGPRRVSRLLAHDQHLPELAATASPAQSLEGDAGEWAAFRQFRFAVDLSSRPPRLLAKPEPIEAIAAVPDGPPVRFRWRRALHEVVAAEGPERIEGAWWTDDQGPTRDYFRVEDSTGCRFWLFRAGLYHGTTTPSWFLHGLFV
jgi:protein ImuB